MTRVGINIIANAASAFANVLVAIILVPFYLRFLGIEAYGVIGFFATLQAVFALMDLGLGITLNRGLARLSATPGTLSRQRDLLRTMETMYWSLSLALGLFVVMLAKPIAIHWIHAEHLSSSSIIIAVRLMGIIAALQLPFALYQAGLVGLQRQVITNSITTGITIIRGAGAIAILAFISPTVDAFLAWQFFVALSQTAIAAIVIWRFLSTGRVDDHPRFRRSILHSEWRFAAGVSMNAIVGALLTQSDKIVLSGILSLSEFGYYTLASTMASILWFAILPVNTAVYPRFAQLLETGSERLLIDLYHETTQLLGAAVIPIALALILFPREIVLLWTRNSVTADKIALPVALLVGGTAINGLISVAAYLQSAAGWPQLTAYTNALAATVLVPALVIMAKHFGAPGAALIWLILNCSYLFVTVPIMHTRLIRGEKSRWYLKDVLLPASAATITGLAFRLSMPLLSTMLARAGYVIAAGLMMAVATVMASDRLRVRFVRIVRAMLGRGAVASPVQPARET